MEQNGGLTGGVPSGVGSGILGLESLPQQNPPGSQHFPLLHHPQPAPGLTHHEPEHHPHSLSQTKQTYPSGSARQKHSPPSDEDDPSFVGDDFSGEGKRKSSPWQRMKWTDSMVRLLIMAVFYIGDEVGWDGNDQVSGKKKTGGGLTQKKGKWKAVSRAMMEKGFYVSPQQCEDKFNDLNKRYKRVNDILGKGTACKVVENQNLLDSMDLSPKVKEEVRKLLNSKHLFFREMCSYHNSFGHTFAGCGSSQSPENFTENAQIQQQQATLQPLQQICSHLSENPQTARNGIEETKLLKQASHYEDDDDDNDGSDDAECEFEEDDDDDAVEVNPRGENGQGHRDYHHDDKVMQKRARKGAFFSVSPSLQQMNNELVSLIHDGIKSPWEKQQHVQLKLMQLEEQQIIYRYQEFELDKQRLKWLKFCSKKEREMERAKLQNKKLRLENERMLLLVRQKEFELLDRQRHYQHQQLSPTKKSEPSSVTG